VRRSASSGALPKIAFSDIFKERAFFVSPLMA
jgi:hypothetical protein